MKTLYKETILERKSAFITIEVSASDDSVKHKTQEISIEMERPDEDVYTLVLKPDEALSFRDCLNSAISYTEASDGNASVLEWHKYPDDNPTAQLVLVAHNNAITTVFGNGLKNFIHDRPYIYWADIPKLPE